MKSRLKRNERKAVATVIEPLLLFQMLRNPLKYYEQQMAHFRLSAEEMFFNCIEVLDYIKSHTKQETKQYIKGLYSTLYCDYRDLAEDNVKDEELQTATTCVIYSLIMLFTQSELSFYNNLATELFLQLSANKIDIAPVQEQFMATYYRLDAEKVKQSFSEYMQDDTHLSNQLQTRIEQTNQNQLIDEQVTEKQFTQKQAVIFTIEALNIALTEINVSAMARLIEKLTGYKGIRPILTNLKNGKDEYSPTDATEVAAYLKEIKPQLATQITNGVLE